MRTTQHKTLPWGNFWAQIYLTDEEKWRKNLTYFHTHSSVSFTCFSLLILLLLGNVYE